MAKLRLQIERKNGNIEIIMKNIISIVIDDIEFKRSSYVSGGRVTGIFYSFVKRNRNKIAFISYTDYSVDDYVNHLHLKDYKLHCEFGEAYQRFSKSMISLTSLTNNNYFLDGEKLTYKEWNLKLRKIKLQKLSSY